MKQWLATSETWAKNWWSRSGSFRYVMFVLSGVAFAWFAWAKWGASAALDNFCPQKAECQYLGQIGDLFGGVNALFAGLAFGGLVLSLEAARKQKAEQRRWEKDKELVDQICASYQWAYDAISDVSNVSTGDQRVRLGWLVAARHLLRVAKLVKGIETSVFKIIQQEHEEMWRSRMHGLTSDMNSLSLQASKLLRPVIDLRSFLVVAEFIVGGDDWKDPIDDVDVHKLFDSDSWQGSALSRVIEKHVVSVLPEFFENHLKRYPDGRIAKERARYAATVEDLYRQAYAAPEAQGDGHDNPDQPSA